MHQKNARVCNHAIVQSRWEISGGSSWATQWSSLCMLTGKAFCWTSIGSSFLIPLNCCKRLGWNPWVPIPCVVLYPTFAIKISPSFATVFCTVPAARSFSSGRENCLLCSTAANAPINLALFSGERLSSQISCSNSISFVYSSHLLHTLASLSLVFFVTPLSLCTSAASRSPSRIFRAESDIFVTNSVPEKEKFDRINLVRSSSVKSNSLLSASAILLWIPFICWLYTQQTASMRISAYFLAAMWSGDFFCLIHVR